MAMVRIAKWVAAKLPTFWQVQLRQWRLRHQLLHRDFTAGEPEYLQLHRWVKKDDWVIDLGANVGNYLVRLAELVGPDGRVIAFEPVPVTFGLLAQVVSIAALTNVTLINAAASSGTRLVKMHIPSFDSGLPNLYMASITAGQAELGVMTVSVDALRIPRTVSLVKIDVEGHELEAIKGMTALLERDRPVLIVEGDSEEVASFVSQFGYSKERIRGSPNTIYLNRGRTDTAE